MCLCTRHCHLWILYCLLYKIKLSLFRVSLPNKKKLTKQKLHSGIVVQFHPWPTKSGEILNGMTTVCPMFSCDVGAQRARVKDARKWPVKVPGNWGASKRGGTRQLLAGFRPPATLSFTSNNNNNNAHCRPRRKRKHYRPKEAGK